MPNSKLIHHYTDIETLALILETQKIRFNRLDRVDDLSESRRLSGINFGKYFFVSCWTHSNEESIPQWHIYTNKMSGVRITFPQNIFNKKPLTPNDSLGLIQNGEIYSPIEFEQLFTDKYFILPSFFSENNFIRDITYEDNLEEIFQNSVEFNKAPDGKASLTINNLFDLASYKKKVWSFQEEIRFILFILPSIPIPPDGLASQNFATRLPNHILNCFKNDIGPDIIEFDIDIAPDILDNIKVTLGPLTSEGHRLVVQALLEKYTKNGILIPSELIGTIRNKK